MLVKYFYHGVWGGWEGCGLSFHSKWILPTMLVIAFLRTWFTVLTLLLNLFQLSFCFWAYNFICHLETSCLLCSADDYLYQLWFFFSKRIFHFSIWWQNLDFSHLLFFWSLPNHLGSHLFWEGIPPPSFRRNFVFLHWNSSSRNIFNNPNIWNFPNFQNFTTDIIISKFSTVVTTNTQSTQRTNSLCNLWLFSNS